MKRLIADAQVFQTAAWHRGMGKYSLELLKAIRDEVKSDEEFALELILSSRIESDPEMERTLKKELADVKIVKLDLLPDEVGNQRVPEQNRHAIDEYIQQLDVEHEELYFLILSAMQGVIYPTFPSIKGIRKLLLFYDIIPFMFHDIYLRNGITRSEYLPRIGELLRADTFLAISKTVANDLSFYLGIDKDRVVSIDGGAIPHSNKEKPVRIRKSFILMPTGNDLRKNNKRAILGFKEFNAAHDNTYNLVITSFFKDHEQAELKALCSDVVFTGNISGAELNYLYNKSTALLFPSEYEGLGMPILEAAEKRKPIACSNISVFREMSTEAFTYFDPYSSLEIAKALEVVTKQKKVDTKEYERLLSTYTWKHSAQGLLRQLNLSTQPGDRESAIVVCSPNPAASSIGGFVQEMHAELNRTLEVKQYFLTHPMPSEERRMNFLPYNYPTQYISPGVNYALLENNHRLYHLGNGEEFAEILLLALANPGVVVLHDSNLEATWRSMVTKALVASERYELEASLAEQLGIPGGAGLATLMKTQDAIVFFDRTTHDAIKSIVKLHKLSVCISFVDRPALSVIYPDALPEKVTDVVSAEKLHDSVAYPTDYQLNTALSKTNLVEFSGSYIDQELFYRAAGLGAVPHISGDALPESIDIRITEENSDSRRGKVRDSLVTIMLTNMQERHSVKLFVQQLNHIFSRKEG